jgi:aminoglycoside phosphotransferase (APT) family kinase protein
MQELPALGFPRSMCLGHGVDGDAAAIVTERIEPTAWGLESRADAARSLAQLHRIEVHQLSTDFQRLLALSDPKEQRSTYWLFEEVLQLDHQHPTWRREYLEIALEVENLMHSRPPSEGFKALVHGDYFSANILPVSSGIQIIDWESCGWGDPMWDFAFLLGADRNLSDEEVAAAIQSYAAIAPVDMKRLLWHKHCWESSWRFRSIMRSFISTNSSDSK